MAGTGIKDDDSAEMSFGPAGLGHAFTDAFHRVGIEYGEGGRFKLFADVAGKVGHILRRASLNITPSSIEKS